MAVYVLPLVYAFDVVLLARYISKVVLKARLKAK
uniref:Uncharacterized protein n=1 Tax=Rhizophora mucronata TaxID=61149 RepID=A0A2P2IJ60_RHIMU